MEARPSRAKCRRRALRLFVFRSTNYHLRAYRGNCVIIRPGISTVKRDAIDRTTRVGVVSFYMHGGQRRPSLHKSSYPRGRTWPEIWSQAIFIAADFTGSRDLLQVGIPYHIPATY